MQFSSGKSRSDLTNDRMLNLSLVHLLEIIGEAAAHVSKEFINKYPKIPWKTIIGMRHRLIHGYYDIDLDIVWKTIEDDIPPLVVELENIIRNEEK